MDLIRVEYNYATFARVLIKPFRPRIVPVNMSAGHDCTIVEYRIRFRFSSHKDIKDIPENTRYECLAIGGGRLASHYGSRIVRGAEQFSKRPIAAVNRRNLKGPFRIVSHIPT